MYQGQVVFATSAVLHIPVLMGPLVVAPTGHTVLVSPDDMRQLKKRNWKQVWLNDAWNRTACFLTKYMIFSQGEKIL